MKLPKTIFKINTEEAYKRVMARPDTPPEAEAKPIKPNPLPQSSANLQDYIILEDTPEHRIVVAKYRLALDQEVQAAAQSLNLVLQETAQEQNGRKYIGKITHAQALDLNFVLGDFTLPIKYFLQFLKLLNQGSQAAIQVYDSNGTLVLPQECSQIYKEITEVREPSRGEHLDTRFTHTGKNLQIIYHKPVRNQHFQEVTEQLDTNTLMEDKTPGIDLEHLLNNQTPQGLPNKNIPNGQLYYWYPRANAVAWFGAYSGRAYLDCIWDASDSFAYLGVRRAKFFWK